MENLERTSRTIWIPQKWSACVPYEASTKRLNVYCIWRLVDVAYRHLQSTYWKWTLLLVTHESVRVLPNESPDTKCWRWLRSIRTDRYHIMNTAMRAIQGWRIPVIVNVHSALCRFSPVTDDQLITWCAIFFQRRIREPNRALYLRLVDTDFVKY